MSKSTLPYDIEQAKKIREKYNTEIVEKATKLHEFLLMSTEDYMNEIDPAGTSDVETFVYQHLLTYYKNRDFLYEALMSLEKNYSEMLFLKIKEKAREQGLV